MSNVLPRQMESESKPVLVLASLVAGASALTGVLAAVPDVPRWVLIALAGVTAVGTAVGGIWTKNQVVPWEDVASKVTPGGKFVAGPAANQLTGTEVTVVSASTVGPRNHPGDTDSPDPGAGNGMNPPYPGL